MNHGMAIGASGISFGPAARSICVAMLRMALLAQERLFKLQEVVVYRTMGVVTGAAGLCVIGMLEEEWAGFFGVAAAAGFPLGDPSQVFGV